MKWILVICSIFSTGEVPPGASSQYDAHKGKQMYKEFRLRLHDHVVKIFYFISLAPYHFMFESHQEPGIVFPTGLQNIDGSTLEKLGGTLDLP